MSRHPPPPPPSQSRLSPASAPVRASGHDGGVLQPPIAPMLAAPAEEIPEGEGWSYEPKWDGFRCIVFRDGDSVVLSSRNERPLDRYFPELLEPLRRELPDRCVVDGEIVIARADGRGLDFDALLQRIHPAASRIQRLAVETPASFVAFDLLQLGDEVVMDEPLRARRARLEAALTHASAPIHLCPVTLDRTVALRWFVEFEGAGLDGVIAKRLDDRYLPDARVLVKVKHRRTADCVVAGYRLHKDGKGVGSLLLGLYDDGGVLHHVGVAASFTARRRVELLHELESSTIDVVAEPEVFAAHPWSDWESAGAGADGTGRRVPGGASRWNAGKDLSWVPLRIELVAEVTFGQLQEGRFRHGSQFLRWRPDRRATSCRYSQIEVASPVSFRSLVG